MPNRALAFGEGLAGEQGEADRGRGRERIDQKTAFRRLRIGCSLRARDQRFGNGRNRAGGVRAGDLGDVEELLVGGGLTAERNAHEPAIHHVGDRQARGIDQQILRPGREAELRTRQRLHRLDVARLAARLEERRRLLGIGRLVAEPAGAIDRAEQDLQDVQDATGVEAVRVRRDPAHGVHADRPADHLLVATPRPIRPRDVERDLFLERRFEFRGVLRRVDGEGAERARFVERARPEARADAVGDAFLLAYARREARIKKAAAEDVVPQKQRRVIRVIVAQTNVQAGCEKSIRLVGRL